MYPNTTVVFILVLSKLFILEYIGIYRKVCKASTESFSIPFIKFPFLLPTYIIMAQLSKLRYCFTIINYSLVYLNIDNSPLLSFFFPKYTTQGNIHVYLPSVPISSDL